MSKAKRKRHPNDPVTAPADTMAGADAVSATGRTMAAPAAEGGEQLQQAEDRVALEWTPGDVILDLYEVKPLDEADGRDFAQGGFGRVYRVHHRVWDVDLAVKSPLADRFKTDEEKANFTAECETWIDLGLHPHIVSCHYVRVLGGIPRVFAEYVEGGSLADLIKDGRLYEGGHEAALNRILDIAIQFAWGLDYAHDKGLVHQDVKPGNVMMTPDGMAKVTDFGLAKARALGASAATVERRAGQSMVVPGAGSYTPEYAAPEQIAGDALTRRADLYAWAVSVFEMFAGGLYWGTSRVVPGQLAQYPGVDADIPESVPVMPEEVKALLTECLEEDAAQRPGTMQAVVDGLLAIYRQCAGEDYLRQPPKTSDLLADGLNNRALSYLDLGKAAEAEAAWAQALAAHPGHVAATYNLGLTRWRGLKTTDVAVLEDLREAAGAGGGALADYAMGQIHLERMDIEAAKAAFEAAREKGGDVAADAEQALLDAENQAYSPPHYVRTFEGRPVPVYSARLSADGRWALSDSGDYDHDKAFKLWDVATGRCLRTFNEHVSCEDFLVYLSADGRWALSRGRLGTPSGMTVKFWDIATGRCLRAFEGHKDSVLSVCLSADERWALSGSLDKALKLWDVATGRCVQTFEGHTGKVNSVCMSANEQWALSGSYDETLKLWDVATGHCIRTFEGHTSSVNSVCLSADGQWALSGSGGNEMDSTLKLWEVSTGRCLRTFVGHTREVKCVYLSADDRWALSRSLDKTLRLWDVATGRCVRTVEKHEISDALCMSVDGRWALSGRSTDGLKLWDLGVLEEFHQLPARPIFSRIRGYGEVQETDERFAVLMSQARMVLEDGYPGEALNLVAEARELSGFRMGREALDLKARSGLISRRKAFVAGWCVQTFEGHESSVTSVCLSSDGRWALSGSLDNTLKLWDVASRCCARTLKGHKGFVDSVCLSADGLWALSGSFDKTLKLWDVATGRCVRTFEGHKDEVRFVCLSDNGRWALSGSWDETLKLWDIATGRCVRTFEGHTTTASSVCLSSDGRWALSGSNDKTLKLWEVATGRCVRTFEGHESTVTSVSLSADGQWALSASGGEYEMNKTRKLWDVTSGRCLRTFGDSGVTCLSGDGRWALSIGRDNTFRLWEIANGQCLRTFEGHTEEVSSACMSADGRWALSGSYDKTLRLWELDWDYEFPGWADWDEDARSYLTDFLTRHTPYAADLPGGREPSEEEITRALTRQGRPVWTDDDFQGLILTLQHAGYGWLRPEGVKRELEKMASEWQGPPPLPGEH